MKTHRRKTAEDYMKTTAEIGVAQFQTRNFWGYQAENIKGDSPLKTSEGAWSVNILISKLLLPEELREQTSIALGCLAHGTSLRKLRIYYHAYYLVTFGFLCWILKINK